MMNGKLPRVRMILQKLKSHEAILWQFTYSQFLIIPFPASKMDGTFIR